MAILKKINFNAFCGSYLMPSRWSTKTIVLCCYSYSHSDEKFNAIPMETELSSEEEHQLEVLRSWLLKIAKLLNVSIVDENEISAILDVMLCFGV